jgi:uncharacterized repeat protein (TIGR01451 family)
VCDNSGATVICALGTVLSGASTSITVIAATTLEDGGTTVTNTATVASTDFDPNTANNSDSATVEIERATQRPAAVDLVIDKSLLDAKDSVGEQLTYLITVVNDGTSTAHQVTIHDTLSNAVQLISATPSRGTCSGAPAIRCSVGDLEPGQTVTVKIVVVPLRDGALTNRATVSAVETDPDPNNNSSGVTRMIRPAKTRHTLTKKANRRSAKPGETVTFTLTYRVRGRAAATGVRVCDRLPRQLSFVSAPGARYRKGAACWSRASVAAGQTVKFRVKVRVASTAAKRTINRATAAAGNAPTARARAALRLVPRAPRGGGVTG